MQNIIVINYIDILNILLCCACRFRETALFMKMHNCTLRPTINKYCFRQLSIGYIFSPNLKFIRTFAQNSHEIGSLRHESSTLYSMFCSKQLNGLKLETFCLWVLHRVVVVVTIIVCFLLLLLLLLLLFVALLL